MSRRRHPNKDIEEAVRYAEASGWKVRLAKRGHAWGQMFCPANSKDCRCGDFCVTSINTTPKKPATHAKQIKRVVDNCQFKPTNKEGDK